MNGDDTQGFTTPRAPLQISVFPPKPAPSTGTEPDPTGGFSEVTPGAKATQAGVDTGGFTEAAPPGPKIAPPATPTGGFTEAPPQQPSLWQKAIEPITSIPQSYRELEAKGRAEMGKGVEAIGKGQYGTGAIQTGFGAFDWLTSPLMAPVYSALSKPVEQATGIPAETTDVYASLFLPVIGFGTEITRALKGNVLEKILNPQAVSPIAEQAGASIREAGGTAARQTEQTAAQVEPFHRIVNAMPEADRLDFIGYVEGRSNRLPLADPKLQQFADVLRDTFEARKTKLQGMSQTSQMSFIQDYFPHLWQDPKKARQFLAGYGKMGTAAALKKRTIPTVADGLAAGLKLRTTNPIEATMDYVRNMDRFIATSEMLDAARSAGTVKYYRPGSRNVPEGWVELSGRGSIKSTPAGPMIAHAPADWARVFNNYISRGFYGTDVGGNIFEAAQKSSNAITAMELGLSGFHAFTMANEGIVSEVARGIQEIVGGKPFKGFRTLVGAPITPVTQAIKGRKFQDIYLGRNPGTPEYRQIVDLLEKAGGRAVGRAHAPDYRFTAMGSYWQSFMRGSLKQEMADGLRDVRNRKLVGGVKFASNQIGRIMQTVAAPIFEKYIPVLKNGAFYSNMKSWLEMNPGASHDQQLAAARQIWDSIDNRFGEMVQDNIFWNKFVKQSAQLAMRSYSWNLGTIREIGGGVKDITQGQFTPRAAYVVALPIVNAAMNSVYQKLKTGQWPQDEHDLIAPRTGAMVPGIGGKGQVPERIMLPGYQKDVVGWFNDWRQEAKNKIATGPAKVGEMISGEDWRGDWISTSKTVPGWLADYFQFAASSFVPISVKSLVQGQPRGSKLGGIETMMGIREAPAPLQDPQGYARMKEAQRRRAEEIAKYRARSQKRKYGGSGE